METKTFELTTPLVPSMSNLTIVDNEGTEHFTVTYNGESPPLQLQNEIKIVSPEDRNYNYAEQDKFSEIVIIIALSISVIPFLLIFW